MRRPSLLSVCLLLALPGLASAARRPKEKYFVRVVGVEATVKVPPGLDERSKTILAEVMSKRREFVMSLAGAPDPAADAAAFKKYLQRKKLRAFNVIIKFTAVELSVLPPEAGKSGQVLSAHIGLSVLGTGIPEGTMAMAGDGSSTVKQEIGAKVRPRDEENVYRDALTGALTSAVEDAARKLAAGPRAKPAKR